MANPVGRPPLFKDPSELDKLVKSYIASGKKTLTGFIIHLGFSSKQTFYNYLDKPEFMDSLLEGMLYVEDCYEEKISGQYSAGPIFAMKNLGWRDKQEIDTTNHVTIVNEVVPSA